MYIGVDIGGSKTLVAVLDENGVILERAKYPTPKNYDDFLSELAKVLKGFTAQDFVAGGLGMPVTHFDRKHGRAINFANLPWKNVSVQHDLEQLCGCPFAAENDAKLAGLSEAMLVKQTYTKVLYVTVSTGIGYALIDNGIINTSIGDGGGRTIMLKRGATYAPWETFASGHAIVERYGKRAVDITDTATWKAISRDISEGLIELIGVTQPDVVVIGGSVGAYFDRFADYLETALAKYHLPLMTIPPVIGAERPEEAVVYGCYDYAKQVFPHAANHS